VTSTASRSPLTWITTLAAFLLLAAAALPAKVMAADAAPDTAAASAFIKQLADDTIATLQSNGSDQEKKAKFSELLEKGVNTDYLSRFVLGRNWNTASADQRKEFQGLFKDFLLANLTNRLSGEYQSQTFAVKTAVPAGSKDVLVRTDIQRQTGPVLPIEWRVRQFDGKWQIIDVKAEGLSLAITQRDEYATVIQRQGMDGLLSALQGQVEKLKEGDKDATLAPS